MRPALLLCALLLSCAAPQRPPAAVRSTPIEVELETRIALPVVLVSVDGGPAQPFIVDTGAATTFVDAAGRPPGPWTIASLSIGGMVLRDVPAQAVALPADLKAAGILCPQEAFRGMAVELDGRSLALRLYPRLDEAGWRSLVGEEVHAAPLRWREGLAFVEASVGGRAMELRLDSGAGGCTLPRETLDALGHAGAGEATLPLAVGASRAGREQVFALEGPGVVGFPWFIGRRAALSADRATLLFTERR